MRTSRPKMFFPLFLACAASLLGIDLATPAAAASGDCAEPNDSRGEACPIAYGFVSTDAKISTNNDIDFYKFDGSRGDVVEILTSNGEGSSLDGALYLLDPSGDCLAFNDDFLDLDGSRSRLTVILEQDGTYWVRVADWQNAPACAGLQNRASRHGDTIAARQTSASKHGSPARNTTTDPSPLPRNSSTFGSYELRVTQIAAPTASDLQAGAGFDGIVPLNWKSPTGDSGFWILGSGSLQQTVERSTNGTTFSDVSESLAPRYIDTSAENGQELFYRVRLEYPYGIGVTRSPAVSARASAGGHRESIPITTTLPTLDGVIDPVEWTDAQTIPLIEEASGAENGTLYVMYDERYLYVGLDRDSPTGQMGLYFDTNNDDSWGTSAEEGNYWIYSNGSTAFRPITGDYPAPIFLESIPSPRGVVSAIASSKSGIQYEVRIDLLTAHFQARPGDVFGFYAFALDPVQVAFSNFPDGALFPAPETFASMTLASVCAEPNESQAEACPVSYGFESDLFEISPVGDADFYRFEGKQGDVVEIRTANTSGSSLDGELYLLDEAGACLAFNDDEDETRASSRLTAVLGESGTYWIRFAHYLDDPTCPAAADSQQANGAAGLKSIRNPLVAAGPKSVSGGTTTGGYTLRVLAVSAPPVSDLRAYSGFDGLVPLSWADPTLWVLGSDPVLRIVERSEDGIDFTDVGASAFAGHLDTSASNGAQLHYRVRLDYPYGIPSVRSEIASAQAQTPGFKDTSPFTATPPDLDGTVETVEWENALTLSLVEESEGRENGTVLMMHDESFLYLAVNRQAETEEIGIYFDTDKDGVWDTGEGLYLVPADTSAFYLPIVGEYPTSQYGTPIENPAGVEVFLGSRQFEVRIDLRTANLTAAPGDSLGLYVYAFGGSSGIANYPNGPNRVLFQTPAAFSCLTLAKVASEVQVASALSFDDTAVGSTDVDSLSITNLGTGDLEITGISFEGEHLEDFSVSTPIPFTIAPQSMGTISIEFAPQVHADYTVELLLTSNDPNSPTTVSLTGRSPNEAPQIEVSNPILREMSGRPLAVLAEASDDLGLASVSLRYRQGGESPVDLPLSESTKGLYEGQVPPSAVSARGLTYRVFATDNDGAVTPSPEYEVRVETSGLTGLELSPSSSQGGYRLVSIPTVARDAYGAFTGSFGNYDPSKWRLYKLRPNQEYQEMSSSQAIAPGEAFWLLSRAGGTIKVGESESLELSSYSTPLNPGWTLVGSPYAFDIPSEQIRTASGAALDVRSYAGSWSVHSGAIEPFHGYAVFSEEADELIFDVTGAPLRDADRAVPGASREESGASRGEPSASRGESGVRLAEPGYDWTVGITARCQFALDDDNRVGVHTAAGDGRDSLDRPEPPTIGKYVSLSMSRPEWEGRASSFSEDIQARGGPHVWRIEVQSNIDDVVELSFDLAILPDSLSIWLVEDGTGVATDLHAHPLVILDSAARKARAFALVVATPGDLDEMPDVWPASNPRLGSHLGFPNPFRGATTIYYQTERPQSVSIDIFGVRGNRVRRLRAWEEQVVGRHSVVWNGRDDLGQPLSAGTYFYRIESEDESVSGRLVLLK